MSDVILFGETSPEVYKLEDIYDPDVDGSDVNASGKIVPAVKSILIGSNLELYVVIAVDPTTYKVTKEPANILNDDSVAEDEIISYGNEEYKLYYDNRVNPIKIVIDSKLRLFGTNSAEYKLYKSTGDSDLSIAAYLDEEGVISGDRIPMVSSSGVSYPADCHTLTSLSDGDIVELHIFNGVGMMTTVVLLTCKQATILNDLASGSNPVVEFNASASQSSGDNWMLYVGQAPDHLAIYPEVVYSDGTKEFVPINDLNCFLYGMEDVETNYPGLKYKLILKYFLAANVESTLTEGTDRFVTLEKWLYVDVKSKYEFSKISVIPIWNPITSKWDLTYFGYYQNRNTFEDITSSITYTTGQEYDPNITMDQQSFQVEITYIPEDGDGSSETHLQPITLTLKTPSDSEPYLILDDPDSSFVYGSIDAIHRRPKIEYDTSLEQYFIPTSSFGTEAIFLENFYTNASPPYLEATEIEAPTPTHFTIREVSSGRVLLAAPVAIDQYTLAFNMLNTGSVDQFVDTTVIVEFLTEYGSTYNILYGVPVEVLTSTTGYNV